MAEDLMILGGGAAGLTAAVYAARANLKPVVFAGPLPGGLLTQTTDVENFPGFPDAVNGYELMFKFQQQAEKFGARLVGETVQSVKLADGGPHELVLGSGERVSCRALIIASGASPRWLGIPSEKQFLNKGVSACATCDGAFFRDVPVAVVGGGDSAMEEALFLTRFASEVHLIHRRDSFRASRIMAERVKANPKIRIHWNSTVAEIYGDAEMEGVVIRDTVSGATQKIACKGYFAALGHVPNTGLFKGQLAMDEAGYIILDGASTRTSLSGVFAAGDCADHVYRQAIVAAGTGARAAIDAERWLVG